jgi:hypothetical protein
MCKECFTKKEEIISLEDLYNKIRLEKDIYEDPNNNCTILLKTEDTKTPLTFSREKDIEQTISDIKIRLIDMIEHTLPAQIVFDINGITKWEASVDVTDINKQNEIFVEETIKNAKQVEQKMNDFKIPNK